MKLITSLSVAVGLAALAACNQSPQEQKADNIEANAEMTADNLEEMADNATTEATENSLENQADATRAAGDMLPLLGICCVAPQCSGVIVR